MTDLINKAPITSANGFFYVLVYKILGSDQQEPGETNPISSRKIENNKQEILQKSLQLTNNLFNHNEDVSTVQENDLQDRANVLETKPPITDQLNDDIVAELSENDQMVSLGGSKTVSYQSEYASENNLDTLEQRNLIPSLDNQNSNFNTDKDRLHIFESQNVADTSQNSIKSVEPIVSQLLESTGTTAVDDVNVIDESNNNNIGDQQKQSESTTELLSTNENKNENTEQSSNERKEAFDSADSTSHFETKSDFISEVTLKNDEVNIKKKPTNFDLTSTSPNVESTEIPDNEIAAINDFDKIIANSIEVAIDNVIDTTGSINTSETSNYLPALSRNEEDHDTSNGKKVLEISKLGEYQETLSKALTNELESQNQLKTKLDENFDVDLTQNLKLGDQEKYSDPPPFSFPNQTEVKSEDESKKDEPTGKEKDEEIEDHSDSEILQPSTNFVENDNVLENPLIDGEFDKYSFKNEFGESDFLIDGFNADTKNADVIISGADILSPIDADSSQKNSQSLDAINKNKNFVSKGKQKLYCIFSKTNLLLF